jgi:hypothetical protein
MTDTLAIPAHSTAIVRHLVQQDVSILDGPRPATQGRVVFDNADGHALRLVRDYFRPASQEAQ